MKAYSGSTSEGFLPALPGAIPAATATAPAPDDPSVSFTDFLQQQAASSTPWATPATGMEPGAPWAASDANPNAGTAPSAGAPWDNLAAAPAAGSLATASGSTSGSTGTATGGFFAASPAALNSAPTPGSSFLNTNLASSFTGAGWKSTPPSVDSTDLESTENAVPAKTAASPASSPTASSPARDALAYFVASQSARPAAPPAPPPSPNKTAESTASTTEESEPSTPTTDPGATPLLSLAHYLWLSRATPGQTLQQPVSAGATAARTAPSLPTTPASFSAAQLAPMPPSVEKSATPSSHSANPTDPASAGTASSTPAQPAFPPDSPLAVLLAQATSLAAGARPQAASNPSAASGSAASGTSSGPAGIYTLAPLVSGSAKTAAASPLPEKKSAEGEAKRSFLQAFASANPTPDATSQLLAGASVAQSQDVPYQSATSSKSSSETSLDGIAAAAATRAGTTNGKKEVDMNATLEMPDLVVSSGTNPLVTRTPADVHILLGTNHDFHEAIEQVMHVAELSNLSLTSNPLRVAIEIQTPPGAIVNVYVSRQADSSYRAQLSTEDVQALGWVQDQIGALKGSTSTGTDIRWAPAQLDISPAATGTTSSSNDGNLDWNRGGNQGGHEPSDERPSRSRTTLSQDEEEADLGLPFLEALGAIGSAA